MTLVILVPLAGPLRRTVPAFILVPLAGPLRRTVPVYILVPLAGPLRNATATCSGTYQPRSAHRMAAGKTVPAYFQKRSQGLPWISSLTGPIRPDSIAGQVDASKFL
jgi:hypothetical protein